METKNISAFLVAAPKSNSGKTMITLGLIHTLVKRGLKVQPFKCGPDYIDTMHHTLIAGRPSYNLDSWMSSMEHVQDTFNYKLKDADVALAEGVMGLFDGAKKDEGSSAAISQLLDLPVILVVDASSTAYSVAPLLFGFKNFNPKVKIAGVIFNKVASQSHYQFLKEAADDAGVISLGYMPRNEKLSIESRHLGLHLPGEQNNREIIDVASELIEEHINVDELIRITSKSIDEETKPAEKINSNLRIAIANDAAFNFCYQANIDVLNQMGSVTTFSPLKDKELPEADLVWLPGGYPELFATELSANRDMMTSIQAHIENGKALVAECGGMIYLGQALRDKNGESNEMVGQFSFTTTFKDMKLHLGYREASSECLSVKGHEFHYSKLIDNSETHAGFNVNTARGRNAKMHIYRYKNCWASYMHLYLGDVQRMKSFLHELNIEANENINAGASSVSIS